MTIKEQYIGFLNSTPLWHNEQFGLSQFPFHTLSSKIGKGLSEITIPKNEVLGKRIERFFEYAIQETDQYEILIKNLQLFRNKITLGELDFLVKDHYLQQIIHIELVCKFYLYEPQTNDEIARWIGPNKKDSLPLKIEKLQKHQFPLLHAKELQPVLGKLKLNQKKIIQQVCYLANLFIPANTQINSFPFINPDCITGYWIRFEDLTTKEYHSKQFFIPQKKNWMVAPNSCNQWFSFQEFQPKIEELMKLKKSPLAWMKTDGDIYSKIFIVWW